MMVDRRQSGIAKRAAWEIRYRSRWGLLLLLATHQLVVGVMLVADVFLFDTTQGIPVPAQHLWPIVFLLGAFGAFDIYVRRYRARVDLAQFLMLLAYGSRALGILWGAIFSGWTTSGLIGLVSWPVLMVLTQWAWTEARSVL